MSAGDYQPERGRESAFIGPFRVLREIGRGQNATVYEAHDTRRDEVVALKVHEVRLLGAHEEEASGRAAISDEIGGGAELAALREEATLLRFVREADAIRRLAHPNIVRIRDAGAEGNRFYIAMERLHGETLRSRLIERGRLSPEAAVAITLQVASALRFAHEQGITHRDVKPDNIFLLPDGTAKLMDFGAARVLGENSLTRTGTVIGSPAYMAPEQVSGQAADGRTDVWGLAATLFEAVTGSKPFSGDSVAAVMYAILHKRPDFRLVPSPGLTRVLERAMAKKPVARYQSIGDFADALRCLPAPGDETVAATRPPRHGAASRLPWPLLLLLAAVVAAALLGGGFLLMRFRVPETRPGLLAPPPRPRQMGSPRVASAPAPVPISPARSVRPPAAPPSHKKPTPTPAPPVPAQASPRSSAPAPTGAPRASQAAIPIAGPVRGTTAPKATPRRPPRDAEGAKRALRTASRAAEPKYEPYPVLPDSVPRSFRGEALLRAFVDEDGLVTNVEMIRSSGSKDADEEALRAVRAWEFKPARRSGRAVSDVVELEMALESE